MYKATHLYTAEQDHILSFSAGESLCVLEKNNDSWWLASNSLGKVGYVPTSYIKKEQNDSNDVVLRSVNNAIEEIIASAPAGDLKPAQKALLKKLVSHKENLTSNIQKSRQSSTKRRAPPPPPPVTTEYVEPSPAVEARKPPAVPQRVHSLPTSNTQTAPSEPSSGFTKHEVPADLGTELMNIMLTTLNVSEPKSRNTLSTLLLAMKTRMPSLESVFDDILQTLPKESKDDESDKLDLALENLREIKDDAQQRNWAIEDDENKIMEILNEILAELTTIEKKSSVKAISYDHNSPIHTLVEYHQMETRVSLRLIILQIFGVVCSLSKTFVSSLLQTVLPLELAMDIRNHTEDTQRTCYSALVMSMLFSTAEPLPVGHYDRLNQSFIQFLIKYIESEMENLTENDDQVVNMFINLILSFNLHMQMPSDNIVMQVIAERGTCTMLSEKLMMLVNRGDDPVIMEEHWEADDSERPPPSVLKFLQDIFSQRSTSTFLYTNDMNVLIDIVTRNLTDLPSGNKLRTDYLDLLLNILTNTDYSETRHRSTDIGQSLNRILGEEQPDTDKEKQILDFDKRIIANIMSNFGHLFS